MVANWSFTPVCGVDFWRVIVTSPEVLIFLFFMITDPKTVPAGQVGRVAFGILVAVVSTLLMAPQTNEFGTKVALLAGLVVVCAARPVLDRLVPEPRSAADDVGRFATGLATGGAGAGTARGGGAGRPHRGAVLVLGVGIVMAGTPARGTLGPDMAEVLSRVPHQIDSSTFPSITVGQDVTDFDPSMEGPAPSSCSRRSPRTSSSRTRRSCAGDGAILTAVDHGDRLDRHAGPARRRDRERPHDDPELCVRRRLDGAAAARSASRPA